MSKLNNPNIWLPRPGEVVAVPTNIDIPDQKKKKAHLLIADEQLFRITLHLHFHVVNPIYAWADGEVELCSKWTRPPTNQSMLLSVYSHITITYNAPK